MKPEQVRSHEFHYMVGSLGVYSIALDYGFGSAWELLGAHDKIDAYRKQTVMQWTNSMKDGSSMEDLQKSAERNRRRVIEVIQRYFRDLTPEEKRRFRYFLRTRLALLADVEHIIAMAEIEATL